MKTRLSIYIHIPFCVKKCLYCDFLSAPCEEADRNEYVEALIDEITYSLRPDEDLWDKYQVESIFFGGGTPTLLSCEQIDRIFAALRERFGISENAEITFECNPGTVDEAKIQALVRNGVNRLSIGLQSADDEELKRLGRIHNYEDFVRTYDMARQNGLHNINVDLMSAIPGQSLEDYRESLKKVLALKPEHISSYSLIIEEGTPYYKRYGDSLYDSVNEFEEDEDPETDTFVSSLPDLPDEDTEREMYYDTARYLGEAGYERYEISNYAKPGKECIHNTGYWTGVDYLGFGLGASSYYRGVRYSNTEDFTDYIHKCHKLAMEENPNPYEEDEDETFDYLGQLQKEGYHEAIHPLTENERMEEYMFLGLREMSGISIHRFYVNFHRDIFDVYGQALEKLSYQKLLIIEGDNIRLTDLGIDVSNQVLSNFLL